MTRLIRWSAIVATIAVFIAAAAGAALPGPQRMVCPSCYGLTEIADGVFTDADPAEHERLRGMISRADRAVAAFYGELTAAPRYVICRTQRCLHTFSAGSGAAGVTFGWHAIRIAPRGLTQAVLIHERAHAELHRRLGLSLTFAEPIPAWFDEGLAVLLSGDARFDRQQPGEALSWIMGARSFRDWPRFTAERGWKAAYGAAAGRVHDIERRVGRAGLKAIVDAVAGGQRFEAAVAAAIETAAR